MTSFSVSKSSVRRAGRIIAASSSTASACRSGSTDA
jgi:hypothetical protein